MEKINWDKLNQMANGKDKPKPHLFCPTCGEVLTDIEVLEDEYDFYCDKCLTSGGIILNKKI